MLDNIMYQRYLDILTWIGFTDYIFKPFLYPHPTLEYTKTWIYKLLNIQTFEYANTCKYKYLNIQTVEYRKSWIYKHNTTLENPQTFENTNTWINKHETLEHTNT